MQDIITMRAWISSIPGSGVAKINPEDFEAMGLKGDETIEVRSAHGAIKLKVVKDDIYEENIIRLKKADAEAIKVRNGDAVFVSVVKEESDEKKKKK
jgi:formylmethanofuran dehydrogenase subunit D